ncbi:MAG: hypothetical protein AAB415_01020 [Patescibacteria group bacterium]
MSLLIIWITVAQVVVYGLLTRGLPAFFNQARECWGVSSSRHRAVQSIALIIAVSIGSLLLSSSVVDPEWSNRLQHALGGGFVSAVVCFLAFRDSGLLAKVGRTRFAVSSFFLVIALGVFNEVAEFILQNYFDLRFASTINDTWLDLISNIVGLILGLGMGIGLFKFSQVKNFVNSDLGDEVGEVTD